MGLASWLLIVLVSLAGAGAEPGASLDQFDWLEGAWEREGGSAEEWKRVSANALEGTAIMERDGVRKVTEHLRIERLGDRIYYIALPLQNPLPTPFALVEHDDDRWVFENPDYDFPTRIVCQRLDATHLRISIEGSDDGPIDFEFTRR
jgi:hypothetical protein